MRKKIIVVGAGPAGMMAAIRAGQLQQEVTLIEKNPILGKKLLLSGKGRCNLTNVCALDAFLARFSHHAQFLRDAFKKFFHQELINFFEKRGLRLKVERQLRVFPVTDKSNSVVAVLKKELLTNQVKILFKTAVKDIVLAGGRAKGLILSDGRFIAADKIILACGGVSYSFTGSTGEGINLARKLGHRIIPLRPGLVPLETRQKSVKALEGLTLKNIRLKFSDGQKQIISEIGELLFTGFGISGPLVLSLSGRVVDLLGADKKVHVEIDLKPALSREQLDARILRELKANAKKEIKNVLKSLLPQRLVGVFLEMAKIDPAKKAGQMNRAERESLVSLCKAWRLDITRPCAIEEAMITRGGVSLQDIDPRTMQSRLAEGLYFAGEMIDVDADTGGFNLQAAFSTGYLAGESAALN